MQANSTLSLKSYRVRKMCFLLNESFDFSPNRSINLSPEFRREINKIDDDNAICRLAFCIKNETLELPFSIDVEIEGVFNLENWEQPDKTSLMVTNTIAILFPYLRSIVTMVTANANIVPYVIPVMNIAALFEQGNSDKEE